MTKGKYGLSLTAIAILAFVLSFFGLLEALILFLAFALILEKDQWLSKQVFQALYLRLAYVVLLTVVGWVFSVITSFFGLFNAYRVINFFNGAQNVIRFILHVGLFVMALIAVLRLAKGNDAGLPVINKLVDKTFGIITPKAKPQPQQAYQAPQESYQAPVQSQQVYQPPAAQAAPPPPPAPVQKPAAPQPAEEPASGKEPSAPKADGSWSCACGRDNNGNFCMSCGKPRPS